MLDCFVPKDKETNDSAVHKQIREHMKEPIGTESDKPFSQEEIVFVMKMFNPKMAPGENGLTSEIIIHAFRSFPAFLRYTVSALKKAAFQNNGKNPA